MFTISNVLIPTPSAFSVSVQEMCPARDVNALGEMLLDNTAKKRVLEYTFPSLTKAQYEALCALVAPVTVLVSYPGLPLDTQLLCYHGGFSADMLRVTDGEPLYTNVFLRLKEK